MGVRLKQLKYFHEILEYCNINDFSKMRIIEFGDSVIRKDLRLYFESINFSPKYQRFREYLRFLGFDVYTIDVRFPHHYAKVVKESTFNFFAFDLNKPIIDEPFINSFDIALNFSTGEHVLDQYEFFKNVHNCLKPNGVAIHITPCGNSWKKTKHSYWLYSSTFYEALIRNCNYLTIDFRIASLHYRSYRFHKTEFWISLVKAEQSRFPDRCDFVWPTKNYHFESDLDEVINRKE